MTHTTETKQKMSQSAKTRWANRTEDERISLKSKLTIAALAKWVKTKNLLSGDPCCQNCLAWVTEDHEQGECHRHPPSGSEGFPVTSFDVFCTECLLDNDISEPVKKGKGKRKVVDVIAGKPSDDQDCEVVDVKDNDEVY